MKFDCKKSNYLRISEILEKVTVGWEYGIFFRLTGSNCLFTKYITTADMTKKVSASLFSSKFDALQGTIPASLCSIPRIFVAEV
jgi:hypothetical protein